MNSIEKLRVNALGFNSVYYVKNKDKTLLSFEWKMIKDKVILPMNVRVLDDATPSFIKDGLKPWLESRTPPKHRRFMKDLLNFLKLDSTKDIIDFSKGLSLGDTFWVTNDESLKWSDVNLFDNEFDDTISKIAFNGGLYGEQILTTSPEFGTNGMLPKCWVRDKSSGIIYLKKGGTDGAFNSGREPYSEVLASQVLDVLQYNHVPYTLERFRGKIVSSCPLLTSKDVMMVPIHQLCRINDIYNIIGYCESKGIAEDLYKMLIFDYIVLNNDRHGGNFAVLLDSDTFEVLSMAPIYDNGTSLLNYYCVGDDLDSYINKYIPALYNSYEELAIYAKEMLSTPHNVEKLISFKFDRSKVPGYSDKHMNIIEDFIQNRVQEFLSW